MALDTTELLLRMGVSIALGAAIGYEREKADRPAGLRTHMLVSLASSTFMIVSTQFGYYQGYTADAPVSVDPSRIASNILTGIGFLGGGAILRSGLNVRGLTTAASLWLVAALGMAAGAGMYLVACSSCIFALFCLLGLRSFDSQRHGTFKRRLTVVVSRKAADHDAVAQQLQQASLKVSEVGSDCNLREDRCRYLFDVRFEDAATLHRAVAALYDLAGVERVRVSRVV